MIHVSEIKTLLLNQPSQARRPSHLSAASGLVKVGPWLYIVADDELHIGKFLLSGDIAGQLHDCFPGELPLEHEARKAQKPDAEVLTLLPDFGGSGKISLLALGSGSKKMRRNAAIIPLNSNGDISGPADLIDLSLFYEYLKEKVGKLNIEGAAIVQDKIFLFQRGNKKNKLNASISLLLDDFYRVLQHPHEIYKPQIQITAYDLGEIDQVPICFTDAATLPGGNIIFTASAENTSDSYLDGICMGSAIGVINNRGELSFLEPVNKIVKLEGIAIHKVNVADNKFENTNLSKMDMHVDLLLVCDADDIKNPAKLYSASLHLHL
jgi:hypothetical protein